MDLRLNSYVEGACVVVSVAGEIDNYTAPLLWDAMVDAFDAAPRAGIVDLSETDFLDSSALGVLVGISKRQQGNGAGLTIVCPKPHLRRLFQISRLDEVIPVCDTLEAAVANSQRGVAD
jgi:anti-sigma B factor antagonist